MPKFKVKDIKPNPFRDMVRNPLNKEKVAALVASFKATEYWENIVARIGEHGKPEIAYGHHRLAALKESPLYGPNAEVNLIIKKLDDATMLKMMANENMEEWGTTLEVTQETIRAVVLAYAAGKVELPRPSSDTASIYLRCAPSFIAGSKYERNGPAARPVRFYTGVTIAKFLGWKLEKKGDAPRRVSVALATLEEEEKGELGTQEEVREIFKGKSTKQAQAILTEHRRAAKQYGSEKAKEVARHVAKEFSEGRGTREAPEIAREVLPKPKKELPDINKLVENICCQLDDYFDDEKMEAIIKYSVHIERKWHKELIRLLNEHAETALEYAEQLKETLPSNSNAKKTLVH